MITRPKPGQMWAFNTLCGRRDTIKSVQSGLCGRFHFINGEYRRFGKQTAMYVKWQSGFKTVTVRELWKNWVFIR